MNRQEAQELVGKYVRLVEAPRSRRGTIVAAREENGRMEFLFHHDDRYRNKISDTYLEESDFEVCERATDEQLRIFNMLSGLKSQLEERKGLRVVCHSPGRPQSYP